MLTPRTSRPRKSGQRLVVGPGEMDGDGHGNDPARDRSRAAASRRTSVGERLQRAEPGGGEIAGDAAHAEAIGAVGRHLDVEHRIVEADRLRRKRWPIGESRGQLDDALVILG